MWEQRGTAEYLYDSVRTVDGPRRVYLGRRDAFGFGERAGAVLERRRALGAEVRQLQRELAELERQQVRELVQATEAANAPLRAATEAVLRSLGWRRHHRSDWRLNISRAEIKELATQVRELQARVRGGQRTALPPARPPGSDPEAEALFEQARSGEAGALAQVRSLILARGWLEQLGDLGQMATRSLIERATGGDPVRMAAVGEMAAAILTNLQGPEPSRACSPGVSSTAGSPFTHWSYARAWQVTVRQCVRIWTGR
jgi:hypothetical protein